jgi:hypothetical protein
MFRLLVTGSRDWSDAQVITRELEIVQAHEGEQVVLVSGHCPNGADKIAEDVAVKFGWMIERHPADWKTHGKRAGFVRNAEMVEQGADYCLAFVKDNSAGASNTVVKARIAKIPTKVLTSTTPVKTVPAWVLAETQKGGE